MTAVFLFIRLVEFIAVVSLIGFIAKIVWDKLWPAIKKLIDKKTEYYDVEKLDDAEIIARKYQKKGKRNA